jgi:trigger factor
VKTSVETLDPVQVKLTVEVEPKRVKQAFDRAARELAKQVNLPGFRPGKVPRRLLEQRFGSEAIAQTAMDSALSDYYVEALQREQLDPVGPPEVDVDAFDEAEGCTFTATVQVRPTIDPPEPTGIEVAFPEWDVTDEDVDEQLTSLRERFSEVDEVDRAAEAGDLITIDLRVEIDGEELESARVEDALYEIGSAGVTPLLDEEAVGKQAGDTFTYVDELPEGYPEHGGEQATFHVTVQDVRAKTLPDLDDDFATTASGFDTIEELRQDVRRSLLARNVQQGEHDVRGRVVEAYLARIDVPLPPAMVESDKDQRLHQLEHQAEQYGLDVDALLQAQETTRERFESEALERAQDTVKAGLVLDALADRLAVSIEPMDLEQEIVRHAQANQLPPQEVARIIQEQGSLPALFSDIRRRKAIDALVDAATIDGAPSQDVLVELGLREDPDAPDADAGAAAATPGSPDSTDSPDSVASPDSTDSPDSVASPDSTDSPDSVASPDDEDKDT